MLQFKITVKEVLMLGYVKAYIPEMKVREKELYNAYYCGICKSIGKRLGQLPRFVLSYDSVFLALLLNSMNSEVEEVKLEHCITNHIKKKPIVVDNIVVNYAADVMVVLAYESFLDDLQDEDTLRGRFGQLALKGSYKKLSVDYKDLIESIEKNLKKLYGLEKEKCNSIDQIGEAFGKVMESVFLGGIDKKSEFVTRPISEMSKHLGRWIYLMDAYDDIVSDIEDGSYNPLIYRFDYKKQDAKEFKKTIKSEVEFSLYHYLSYVSDAFNLLNIEKNEGILSNIVNLGLLKETERIMED